MDIDYINFVKGKDAADTDPIGTLAIGDVRFQNGAAKSFRVYGLSGKLLGTVDLTGTDASSALKAAGYTRGVYMLKQVRGGKKLMVNTAR